MDFLCPGCQAKFKESEELLDHFLKTHMGGEAGTMELQCSEEGCEETFPSLSTLQQHCTEENHGQDKVIWTQEIITNGDELIVTNVPEGEASDPADKEDAPQESKASLILAKIQKYRRESALQHPQETAGNSNTDIGDDLQETSCRDCGKEFSSKYNLDRHLQLHKGVRYPCVLCGKVYSQKYAWSQHMKLTHKEWREPTIRSGERTWRAQERCPYCSEYFPTLGEIERHVSDRHCLGPWD